MSIEIEISNRMFHLSYMNDLTSNTLLYKSIQQCIEDAAQRFKRAIKDNGAEVIIPYAEFNGKVLVVALTTNPRSNITSRGRKGIFYRYSPLYREVGYSTEVSAIEGRTLSAFTGFCINDAFTHNWWIVEHNVGNGDGKIVEVDFTNGFYKKHTEQSFQYGNRVIGAAIKEDIKQLTLTLYGVDITGDLTVIETEFVFPLM